MSAIFFTFCRNYKWFRVKIHVIWWTLIFKTAKNVLRAWANSAGQQLCRRVNIFHAFRCCCFFFFQILTFSTTPCAMSIKTRTTSITTNKKWETNLMTGKVNGKLNATERDYILYRWIYIHDISFPNNKIAINTLNSPHHINGYAIIEWTKFTETNSFSCDKRKAN